MAAVHELDQPPRIDMRVDLRGCNIGVAEEKLNRTQVGAAFEKMGREGMAKDVRADPFRRNSCVRRNLSHQLIEADTAEMLLAGREEIDGVARNMSGPFGDGGSGPVRDRNQTFAPAFATKDKKRLVGRNGIPRKRNQFGCPEPRSVEQLHKRCESNTRGAPLPFAPFDFAEQGGHGIMIEDLRQRAFGAWSRERA